MVSLNGLQLISTFAEHSDGICFDSIHRSYTWLSKYGSWFSILCNLWIMFNTISIFDCIRLNEKIKIGNSSIGKRNYSSMWIINIAFYSRKINEICEQREKNMNDGKYDEMFVRSTNTKKRIWFAAFFRIITTHKTQYE